MYVDLHCHLLPGVDDGVGDWEESALCLEAARREKISALCVTPHIAPPRFPNTPTLLREAFEAWREPAESLGFTVHLGSEISFGPRLVSAYRAGKLIPMGEAGRYLLVELPLLLRPPGVEEVFFDLRMAGVEPILAHPERYAYVTRDPGSLAFLAAAQIPFQLTTHSLVGYFGQAIRRAAWALLDRGWVHLLASDAHSASGRAPLFREAVRSVARRYGIESARRLCIENPRRVLAGEPLLAVAGLRTKGRRR
ncbi:MAG: tyrosine-protein phosphatase [Acidobacteriota bacterium]